MTTSVASARRTPARAPRPGSPVRSALVALTVAVAVLVGWSAPLGAQVAPARLTLATVSGASVGQASAAAARAARATLAGATIRGVQLSAAQGAVRDGSGGAPVPPLVVGILAAALVLGARGHLVAARRRSPVRRGSAGGTHDRDRAPPSAQPATA